jgi:hypothetical protein
MKKLLFIILTFTASLCYSQNEIKKGNFALKLAVDSDNLSNGCSTIKIFFIKKTFFKSMQPIDVEVEIKSDTIFSMKVVEKIVEPKRHHKLNFHRT